MADRANKYEDCCGGPNIEGVHRQLHKVLDNQRHLYRKMENLLSEQANLDARTETLVAQFGEVSTAMDDLAAAFQAFKDAHPDVPALDFQPMDAALQTVSDKVPTEPTA